MATMNLVKATMVAVVFAGPMAMAGSAMASEPVASESTSEVSAVASAGGVDGSGQDSGVQAYCYWETYCNVYGYCWTNWVCF